MKLDYFAREPFLAALHTFFQDLNIPLNAIADEPMTAERVLGSGFKPGHEAHGLIGEIYALGALDDAAFASANAAPASTRESAAAQIEAVREKQTDYDSILVFGVALKSCENDALPARSQLAEITRAFNRAFHYTPVVVVFRYGLPEKPLLAFASCERSAYTQAWREGEKAGKVSLLRDIDALHTHAGHERILRELRINPLETDSFAKLYAHWQKVLSVSILNRDFFVDYKAVFELVENAAVLPKEHEDKRRDWTQRLFNRLLFLRFLEKKGWLEFEGDKDYLRALFEAAKANKESFLKDRLFWLFFRGLNTAAEEPTIHRMPELIERRGTVPFLNGGLFDLEDVLDAQGEVKFKKENEVFEAILGLFEKYYFTVDETTPLEQEIGIDPEMLGKVFEELTNERTASGSYYTPRVVVSFMARAALKGYLSQRDTSAAIAKFVDHGDASGLKRPREILAALEEVRVCDPACGSGAYLLGMMQELLRLRDALFTAHEIDALEVYDRKLEIIERNLYGADLTDFAVNIAMLRLWLSLIVDYNGAVTDLPALPNLQYKIGRGDSLTAPNPTALDLQKDEYQKQARVLAALQKEWFEESYLRSKGRKTRAKSEIKADLEKQKSQIQNLLGDAAPTGAHDWRLRFAEVFAHDGFDIVIANPPYGASVADATRDLYFARRTGEAQSKDTYGLFMARGLQLLKPGGWFSFIVSDTWRTIKSHRPLRKRLLEQTHISHVLDLPPWIFGATVNTGVLTFQKGAPPENHTLIAADVRGLAPLAWDELGAQLGAVAGEADDQQTLETARYTISQNLIGTYDNASFFIADPTLYQLMSDKRFRPLGEVADVKQGLATADNEYYLRKRDGARGSYEILDEAKLLRAAEIKKLAADEKLNGVDPKKYDGRHFVPYDKGGASDAEGGWMPNYFVPTEYFIDWSKAAVKRLKTATIADVKTRKGQQDRITAGDKTRIASRFQNQPFYFREGITASRVGIYSPTFRNAVIGPFDSGCSNLYSEKYKPDIFCALLCSTLFRYLFISLVNHTVNSQVDDLKEIPIPALSSAQKTKLETLVSSIIAQQKTNPRYEYWLHEQREIDALVYELYDLNAAQIREVELWYCRRYPKLAAAQGVLARVSETLKS